MSELRTAGLAVTAAAAFAVGGVVVGGIGPAHTRLHALTAPTAVSTGSVANDALATSIIRQQQELRAAPRDWQAWATLGLDYVEQAKLTVDPTYYPKADGALHRSLALDPGDNFVAMAGEAALSAARHDFRAALSWARRGLRIDPSNAVLHGALCDALTQLGRYRAAEQAARTMELLSPGSDAEARLSYAAELRGDTATARGFMRLALSDAVTAADAAFARYYLGHLDLATGHAAAALADYRAGLLQSPSSSTLLEGRARAEEALGNLTAAARDLADVVARVPQPSYVLEYGELLQAMGRPTAAKQQFNVFRAEEQLFRANGVTLDTDQALFEADHGSPVVALQVARAALRTRPFLETYDAYAWALHLTGQDRAALRASDRALATGMKNALFSYHRAVIEAALGDDHAASAVLRTALRLGLSFDPLRAPQARRLLATFAGAR